MALVVENVYINSIRIRKDFFGNMVIELDYKEERARDKIYYNSNIIGILVERIMQDTRFADKKDIPVRLCIRKESEEESELIAIGHYVCDNWIFVEHGTLKTFEQIMTITQEDEVVWSK